MFRKLNLGHFYLHHINLSGLIHKGCKIQVYLAPTELSISLFLFLPANKQEDKGEQIQERKNFLKKFLTAKVRRALEGAAQGGLEVLDVALSALGG